MRSPPSNDFLEYRLQNYSAVTTYGPVGVVDTFGIATELRLDNAFGYAYYSNDHDWSEDAFVADREALESRWLESNFGS